MVSYIIMCGILFRFFVNPSPIIANENSEINWQNFQLTLLSIEEKLQSLESFVIVQCGTRLNGKIDYYGRKIDNIEKTLSRLEMQAKVELEKITENISSKNFKEDISNGRIIRNIDIIYEKINHKLTAIGEQTDLTNIKMKNIGETVTAKLDKIEENLTIRDADIEAELSDNVAAMDDLKTSYTTFGENTMSLITQSTEKLLKNSERLLNNQYTQMEGILDATSKNISDNFQNIQETVQMVLVQVENTSNVVNSSKEEMIENLNEYANKIIDIHTSVWKETEVIDSKLDKLSKTANLSRNEQQNSLRGLTVQLGRLSGKPNVQSDSFAYNKLEELNKKMDENFRDVMLSQNLFLESCHRVQMDEAQIESQIGVVLNKLIDIFENKTSVRIEDFRHLEQTIRTHDSNTKRALQNTLNSLQSFFTIIGDEHSKIDENFNKQKENLEIVHILLRDILNSQDGRTLQSILQTVKNLENYTSTQEICNLNSSNLTDTITTELSKINQKLDKCCINNQKDPHIASLISKIFSQKPKPVDYHLILDKQNFNTTKTELDKMIESLNKTDVFCEKIDNYTFSIMKEPNFTILNCLPLYIDLIDVRYGSNEDEFLNCSVIKTNNKEARNCLPNYIDIIDVRFNRDNFTDCINADVKTTEHTNETGCLPNYLNLIDVRFSSNCTVTKNVSEVDSEQKVITDWDHNPEPTTPTEDAESIILSNKQ